MPAPLSWQSSPEHTGFCHTPPVPGRALYGEHAPPTKEVVDMQDWGQW